MGVKRTVLSQTAELGSCPGSLMKEVMSEEIRCSRPESQGCLQAVLLVTGEQNPRVLEERTKF